VDTLRFLPVETVEAACDDVFRCLVERLGDRVVALVRPVAGKDLIGPAPQKHVELIRDNFVNDLACGVVDKWHGPASVAKPVAPILLRTTRRLHDAVESDLGDCDDLSHSPSPLFSSTALAQIAASCASVRGHHSSHSLPAAAGHSSLL